MEADSRMMQLETNHKPPEAETMPIDTPPAIVAPTPRDSVALMLQLASLTPTTADAETVLATYKTDNAKMMWKDTWGVEICIRAIALREKDPAAKIPAEWVPLR